MGKLNHSKHAIAENRRDVESLIDTLSLLCDPRMRSDDARTMAEMCGNLLDIYDVQLHAEGFSALNPDSCKGSLQSRIYMTHCRGEYADIAEVRSILRRITEMGLTGDLRAGANTALRKISDSWISYVELTQLSDRKIVRRGVGVSVKGRSIVCNDRSGDFLLVVRHANSDIVHAIFSAEELKEYQLHDTDLPETPEDIALMKLADVYS